MSEKVITIEDDPSKSDLKKVESSVVKKFPKPESKTKSMLLPLLLALIVIVSGGATGWALSRGSSASSSNNDTSSVLESTGGVISETEMGIEDKDKYPDTVEGLLVEGGLKGEGTHYIDRDLGPSKYVYLTSALVDFSLFVEKKVEVQGATISAQHVPWLLDVGKIKVVE